MAPDGKGDAPVDQEEVSSTSASSTEELTSTAASTTTPPSPSLSPSTPTAETVAPSLERARAFLRDEAVRNESRARKAAFLAAKGFSSAQIDEVLDELETDPEVKTTTRQVPVSSGQPSTKEPSVTSSSTTSSSPLIVTYPEFIARPPQPPPLVTPAAFTATLYGSAAAASLIYGTARLVLAPMVGTLADARGQLQATTRDGLTRVVRALEAVVGADVETGKNNNRSGPDGGSVDGDGHSTTASDAPNASDASDSPDPITAAFSRDASVQTSPSTSRMTSRTTSHTASTALISSSSSISTSTQYAHLASMADQVKRLCDDWAGPDDVLAETQTALDMLRSDVDKLARPSFVFGADAAAGANNRYPGYVQTTRNEPDDEIRRAKENIRRVKGALLTTRTFPTAR
ncbi:peroxisomal membrane anchor [Grosmannia clavigera kw1407]|uniref:Peroxisomal membrane anchor n=1 Tax=Grosmannia clavigera (strain kw1407 / UAMH 11150) TaxID=655863 RepID=F0X6I9_GROCL|nr:peroxisomal membrane anchor [Grosmannia clavigera kw1407]EFX06664.1 peroxisomal membrane anchor [Grosmannia clavigera kw1407]